MAAIIIMIVSVGLCPTTANAQSTTNRGLFISPPRNFLDVDAGKTALGEVMVANYTQSPLTVTLSVEEFSVSDYSYNYTFSDVTDNWLHFSKTVVLLEPGKNERVTYSVTPPARTAPGGKYYTIIAGATVKQKGVSSRIQVAAPLYMTIRGNTTQTNTLRSHTITTFVVGDRIPFSLDIANTGNVHYTATVHASIGGPWTNKSTVSVSHILLPGVVRHVDESVQAPLFPGIYKVTYGYTTDISQPVVVEGIVVYTPLWFYAVVIVAGWGIVMFARWRRRIRHQPKKPTTTDSLR